MTKKALKILRDASYRPPNNSKPRCETCEHFSRYGNNCCAVEIRGTFQVFKVEDWGVCDLWEKSKS